MKQICLALLCALGPVAMMAQARPSTAEEIAAAARARLQARAQSPVRDYPMRAIGPTVQGGRIVDIEVDPRSDKTWYVGYASGGLFKTTNNGQSFAPVFDGQLALGIGDFAIAPSAPDVLYLGSGENNSSRSSYAGAGMFRSADGGKTWTPRGLVGTQHIGRVLVHPTDPNTVWVAAMGALYTDNADRGVFRSTDGGETWQKTLYLNDKTGAIDLVLDPANPDRLYAALWQRDRKAWEFDEDGPGSGLYRSTDGGRSWQPLRNGLPSGETVGRFGLAASPSQAGLLYAVLDNQEIDPKLQREDTIAGLTARMLTTMKQEDFLKLEDSKLDSFLEESGYPDQYKAAKVKADLREGRYTLKDVAEYFGDANNALFQTAVKGTELYRSLDYGDTWTKVHSDPLTGVFFTYGYYFGQVRVAPDRPEEIYTYGVPLIKSTDGGKSWTRIDTVGDVHVDHHALWFNPKDPDHILLGNDGGLYLSYDRGAHLTHLDNVPVGQFYTVAVDMEEPYNVYGGLQDNGVLKGSSRAVVNRGKDWTFIGGGDGMCVVIDPKKSSTYYTGYQFGNYYRYEQGKRPAYITPRHDIGAPKYRWNWRTPVVGSPHNHEILYMGSQYLHRSLDMGEHWEAISGDLTTNRQPQGNVPYATITTISESPRKFGLLWVGTDDGKVQLTTDGGNTWQDRSAGLPAGLWVSSLTASPHNTGTAFLSLTGYRMDDFHAYLYRTDDFGKTWRALNGDLPAEAVNIVLQDPAEENLLYCGTDHGAYASTDAGTHWLPLGQVPNVATYDLLVHPREPELVVATHGRSIFVADITLLRTLAGALDDQVLFVQAPGSRRFSQSWGKRDHPYESFDNPTLDFQLYARQAAAGEVQFKVLDGKGKTLHTQQLKVQPGYNAAHWDLKITEKGKVSYLQPGKYQLQFSSGKESQTLDFQIKE
jgi:photosystem II stability/assembly factor-like uncharacterized protein